MVREVGAGGLAAFAGQDPLHVMAGRTLQHLLGLAERLDDKVGGGAHNLNDLFFCLLRLQYPLPCLWRLRSMNQPSKKSELLIDRHLGLKAIVERS